jgi:hypothetical protein
MVYVNLKGDWIIYVILISRVFKESSGEGKMGTPVGNNYLILF